MRQLFLSNLIFLFLNVIVIASMKLNETSRSRTFLFAYLLNA